MLQDLCKVLALGIAFICLEADQPQAFTQTIEADTINGVIYVRPDGKYPATAEGIQAAIDESRENGGGKVVLPPTRHSPIEMGATSLRLYSNVCLVGAAMNVTVLNWSGPVNAIAGGGGLSYACVRDLTLSFSEAAAGSSGIRLFGTDAEPTQYNDFENVYIKFASVPGSLGAGVYATSSGTGTDITLNTFRNIIVSGANQFAQCGGCEGNFWIGVQGVNVGQNPGAVMFEENGLNGDEIVIARMESGSSNFDGEICFSTTGSNNLITLTCDGSHSGDMAVMDFGQYNILDIGTVGAPTLGAGINRSEYRYVSSHNGTHADH